MVKVYVQDIAEEAFGNAISNPTLDYSRTSGRFLPHDLSESKSDDETYDEFERNMERSTNVSLSASSSTEEDEKNETLPLIPRQSTRQLSKRCQILILCACMTIHYVSMGVMFGLGVVYVELIREFNASKTEAALVQSVYMGVTIGFGYCFNSVIKAYGVGICAMVGAFVGSIGMFIGSFSVNIYMAIAFVGAIGGIGMSSSYLCAALATSFSFRGNQKIALGLLTVASAFGQVTFPRLSQYLLELYRWNGTFLIYSGIMLNCVLCAGILHASKDNFQQQQEIGCIGLNAGLLSIFKDKALVVILIFEATFMTTNPVETLFIVDLAVLRGDTINTGCLLLSLMGVMGIIGRLFGIGLLKLIPTISAAIHCGYSSLLLALAHFMVIYFAQIWGTVTGVLLRGFSFSIIISLFPGLMIELRGQELFPQTIAITNIVTGISQVASGFIGGAVTDATGSYDVIFYVSTGGSVLLALLCVILFILIRRKRRFENS